MQKIKTYKQEWKNQYAALYKANNAKKYPQAFNSGLTPEPKFPKITSTNGLTKFVIDMINFSGGYANRISSSGRLVDVVKRQPSGTLLKDKKWITGTTKKGTADIHAIINGLHFSIEIKSTSTRDKMSEWQHEECKRVQAAGGNYMIVKDADSFCTALKIIFKQQ